MVFYESYLMLSKRLGDEEIRALFRDLAKIIHANDGVLFRLKDLGWRKTCFRVDKPRVGFNWYGRFFYTAFSASPKVVSQVRDYYRTHAGVLRKNIFKMHNRNMYRM
ncbi:unnamed protein product [Vitrella brassicaformis CCMP3155]|uniref:Ribosomal protein S6 n=2 Tax=Vitrella brassicaformis TaxID=1169539 RepID=A0A0G4ENM1_VITBC|nr:unnamed protein product [Vitrella brassicaformis CCMP3155]|mmetsp:Transcript_41374/g.103263  ORF Transcript_41374/g.103263 Transcript_41374/m.103263 type:complete len:107 (+) Transcript_41374:189-509(+)|eukprot:CEL98547.1 unnamed protein product [Vitrella brassicaformis CCMP3155]